MKIRCKPIQYCTLEECSATVQKYNLGIRSIKNKILAGEFSSAKIVSLPHGKKELLINKNELENVLLSSRTLTNIEALFALVWNDMLERGLHYYTATVRNNWKRYFNSKLPQYERYFDSYEDFFELKPKLIFFQENKNIVKILPVSYRDSYLEILSNKNIHNIGILKRIHKKNDAKIYFSNALQIVQSNGLNRRWLTKAIRNNAITIEKASLTCEKGKLNHSLLSYNELITAIENSAPISTLATLIQRAWSFEFAQALSSDRIEIKKKWAQNFTQVRVLSSYSFYTPQDFLVLRPKYAFFAHNAEFLYSALSLYYKRIFIRILVDTMSEAKKFIENNIQEILEQNQNVNYEQLLYAICDNAVFGIPPSKTCKQILHKASYKKESHSTKEVVVDSIIIEKLEKQENTPFVSAHDNRSAEEIIAERDCTQIIEDFLQSENLSPLDSEILRLRIAGEPNTEIIRKLGLNENYKIKPKKKAILNALHQALEDKEILR